MKTILLILLFLYSVYAIAAPNNTDLILYHPTDCTTFTAAINNQYCCETDINRFYRCQTSDVCDTAGEWVPIRGTAIIQHTFIMPFEDPTGNLGNWGFVGVGSSGSIHFILHLPEDFISVESAEIVMIPDATETIQWDIFASVAADGGLYNADDRQSLDQTQDVTVDTITHVSIAGVLTGLEANDIVAIEYQSDTAALRIIGLEFNYN